MINKINGIDVSECSNFKDWICSKRICELSVNENCLFKRFKRLQKENDELKKRQITKNGFICDCEQNAKFKQALEEIRKEANRLLYEENPIYGYNNSNYFEILAKYVLAKTKEVLNDRS